MIEDDFNDLTPVNTPVDSGEIRVTPTSYRRFTRMFRIQRIIGYVKKGQ